MAALDAAWAILEHSDDPVRVRAARERTKAVGEIAAMARKVVMLEPAPRTASAKAPASPAGLSLEPALETVLAPVTAQAEIARRALDKLKGGRRGRL